MSRIRSPRYPSLNLEETIDLIAKIHSEDRQHPVSREVAAKHMGFSGISGTSDRALAALMHYGLAEKATKGEIRVSDRALRILHPHHENERLQALNEAGFLPELFRDLRKRYPETPPSAASLESFLSRQGFAPVAIRPASKAYLETCQFLQRNDAYESVGIEQFEESESAETSELKDARTMEMTPIRTPSPSPSQPMSAGLRGDVFTLQGGGEIIANLPDALTPRDFEDLKDWLELMIRKAGRKVIQSASSPSNEPPVDPKDMIG